MMYEGVQTWYDLGMATGAIVGFYEITSQILPLFFLGMLVGEWCLGANMPKEPSQLGSRLLTYFSNVLIVLTGEVAALIAVATGETFLLHLFVCTALASSVGILLTQFVQTTMMTIGTTSQKKFRNARGALV